MIYYNHKFYSGYHNSDHCHLWRPFIAKQLRKIYFQVFVRNIFFLVTHFSQSSNEEVESWGHRVQICYREDISMKRMLSSTKYTIIPYGQSSAKLPVIGSHCVIIKLTD